MGFDVDVDVNTDGGEVGNEYEGVSNRVSGCRWMSMDVGVEDLDLVDVGFGCRIWS